MHASLRPMISQYSMFLEVLLVLYFVSYIGFANGKVGEELAPVLQIPLHGGLEIGQYFITIGVGVPFVR